MSAHPAIRAKRKDDPLDLAAERDWDATVADYATLMGWWTWHEQDSRRSVSGMLDRLFLRTGRVVFAELKVPGGRVRPAQARVLELLRSCPGVETYLWTLPDDWPSVREVLR